jgi:restriction endonuclease S subunit
LYETLKYYASDIADLAGGMTFKEVSKTVIANFKIPLPPLEVQQQIIDECEAIERNVTQAQNTIKQAREEIKTMVIKVAKENGVKSLHNLSIEIIDGDRGINYPKSQDFSNNGFCIFLNASNFINNKFDLEECDFITIDKDNLLRNGKLKRNDIVVTTRGTIGKVAFYHDQIPYEHIRINSGMIILRNKEEDINTQYLFISTYV